MSIKQIIFKGAVVFVLEKRNVTALQGTSVSAAELVDGRLDGGQETMCNLKVGCTL